LTSEEGTREGRRSPRIIARIPLGVRPIQYPSTAITAVVNLHGALILSPVLWPPGTILEIRNEKTKLSTRGRVVWSGAKDELGSHKLGVEFEIPAGAFWGDDHPEGGSKP